MHERSLCPYDRPLHRGLRSLSNPQLQEVRGSVHLYEIRIECRHTPLRVMPKAEEQRTPGLIFALQVDRAAFILKMCPVLKSQSN
jgi:hypothetical protein